MKGKVNTPRCEREESLSRTYHHRVVCKQIPSFRVHERILEPKDRKALSKVVCRGLAGWAISTFKPRCRGGG